MTARPEVVDFTSHPDLEWAAKILATAKEIIQSDGELRAVLFMRTPLFGDQIIRVGAMGDFNDDRQKDALAYAMKETAKIARPTAVAFLSDTYVHVVPETSKLPTKLKEDLEDGFMNFKDWPKAIRDRYVRTREAITLSLETYDLGQRLLVQFYKRVGRGEDMRIEFEECEGSDITTEGGGRMQGILPRREGQ